MKERIIESASLVGLPPNVDISVVFSNMSKMLDTMKKVIDKEDLDA